MSFFFEHITIVTISIILALSFVCFIGFLAKKFTNRKISRQRNMIKDIPSDYCIEHTRNPIKLIMWRRDENTLFVHNMEQRPMFINGTIVRAGERKNIDI